MLDHLPVRNRGAVTGRTQCDTRYVMSLLGAAVMARRAYARPDPLQRRQIPVRAMTRLPISSDAGKLGVP